ncbi:MAG TPA: hypothetical protein VF038_03430 [Usitatibacter sp.]
MKNSAPQLSRKTKATAAMMFVALVARRRGLRFGAASGSAAMACGSRLAGGGATFGSGVGWVIIAVSVGW